MGKLNGIYHGYPNVSQCDNVLEVFTDSDWASDRGTRRSVSCCVMFYGSCLLYSAFRTQKVVSVSSAEVYACSGGASDSILLARLLGWLTGRKTWIYIYTDSSGAKGILQRQGVGRLRHLTCRILWLQNLISAGTIRLCSVSGQVNLADIGTKRLSAARLRSLMTVLGLYNRTVTILERLKWQFRQLCSPNFRIPIARHVCDRYGVTVNALDDAERAAYEVGSHLVQTINAASSNFHINAVADAMINMISSNFGEGGEEEVSESVAEMETETVAKTAKRAKLVTLKSGGYTMGLRMSLAMDLKVHEVGSTTAW
eukprot:s6_g50.t1